MTNSDNDEGRSIDIDLSRLRSLAEEGRARPLLGGSRLVVFGCAIIAAALMQFLIQTQVLVVPMWAIAISWFVIMACAGVAARLSGPRKSAQGAIPLANQIERQVWRAGGALLAIIPIAILIISYWQVSHGLGKAGFYMFAVLPSLAFGIYAVALSASATAGALPWLQRFAWLSIIFAGLAIISAYSVWQMPVLMIGALLVSVIPGLRLTRIVRSEIGG